MDTIFHTIRLGSCKTYLIQAQEGFILVDCGNRGLTQKFHRRLLNLNITPSQVKLIIITHAHHDHVGSLAAIKEMCHCPIAVHEAEQPFLSSGKAVFPPGSNLLGKVVSKLGTLQRLVRFDFDPVEPDILVHSKLDLMDFGLVGRLVHTPGHTRGSMSLVLEGGHAFIGDTIMSFLPGGRAPIFPLFVEDVALLLRSWQELLTAGAETFYPAHGGPVSRGRLIAQLQRRIASSPQ